MTARPDPILASRPDREISCRGMRCPLPVIYTRKALEGMKPGQLLRVVAADAEAAIDIAEFSRRTRTEVVAIRDDAGDCTFILRKC